jgi:hypothetical protein
VYANLISNSLRSGVQGWSLSARVTGGLLAQSATDVGTASANAPDGLRNTGFVVAETVNPELIHEGTGEPQGQGFVAATVLSFILPVTLPPSSTATVLCMTVATPGPVAEDEIVTGSVVWFDDMRGAGQPVGNRATVMGTTNLLCSCQQADLCFVAVSEVPFLRCDPNDDAQSNLADAVWIVNELFRGGEETACTDSADCNDDGSEDLSDALYCVSYQFRGGAPPPAPFPACALDPTGDELDCTSFQSCPQ